MHSKSSESSVVPKGPGSCQEKAFTDHYQVLKDIGHGAFRKVILARHLCTGAEVAVKILPKRLWRSLTCPEKLAMKTLNHLNVIHLFQVIETHRYVYLVMEHGGRGSLFDLIPPGGM
ncbi:Hypothetical predicted protein [Marmota monax]|uniref:non-specific serine/threonine protein kinase n=1 Tax=Marmota monax TaxID=9995 RepID=A0A5E4AVN3_MARMO|nr:Hypothetical predicted protein [Marmota monax]